MPNPLGPKYSNAALTAELRYLATQLSDEVDEEGNPLTNMQLLGRMIWRQAKGWTELTRDDSGNLKEVKHPPVAWCQQYIFERCDGKAAQAAAEENPGIKTRDRVAELAKDRINRLASIAAGPPKTPPTTPPK